MENIEFKGQEGVFLPLEEYNKVVSAVVELRTQIVELQKEIRQWEKNQPDWARKQTFLH